jgi:ribosome biogenesis protein MAK21
MKQGDPNRSTCSKVGYLLGLLLQKHPNMRAFVVDEVQGLLSRANLGQRAIYYSANFLTQIVLSRHEPQVATKLINIYLGLFQDLMTKEEEVGAI